MSRRLPKAEESKIARDVNFRITELQRQYIEALWSERQRKRPGLTKPEVFRDLLDLGIKTHRQERRERYEMSGYFRAELRTFTENFFKENNNNFLTRLIDLSRNVRFIVLLLVESLSMQIRIWNFQINRDIDDVEEQDRIRAGFAEFADQELEGVIDKIYDRLGPDGQILRTTEQLEKGIPFDEGADFIDKN